MGVPFEVSDVRWLLAVERERAVEILPFGPQLGGRGGRRVLYAMYKSQQ